MKRPLSSKGVSSAPASFIAVVAVDLPVPDLFARGAGRQNFLIDIRQCRPALVVVLRDALVEPGAKLWQCLGELLERLALGATAGGTA